MVTPSWRKWHLSCNVTSESKGDRFGRRMRIYKCLELRECQCLRSRSQGYATESHQGCPIFWSLVTDLIPFCAVHCSATQWDRRFSHFDLNVSIFWACFFAAFTENNKHFPLWTCTWSSIKNKISHGIYGRIHRGLLSKTHSPDTEVCGYLISYIQWKIKC